ncbi:MAG: UDP-N-acetyl glucosamine 2-epimerase, partial [Thermoanaerobacteraceae bacterium]|nr:UDP-N-acetyl glucosamine 2-epimerase [Thermoanaerobacteraceae bacterium]
IAGEIKVVLPLHPRTREALIKSGMYDKVASGICLTEPVGYLDMVMLEKNARLIATDSGGVQKEAFFYRVPCVTLREETEWVELVELGWNILANPVFCDIITIIKNILEQFNKMDLNAYKQSPAAKKIIAYLIDDVI